MDSHLPQDVVVAMAETDSWHPHLETCARCRALVIELRDALAAAREASVPEPSPLFWSRFQQRVRAAVESESPKGRVPAWRTVPVLAAAAVLVLVVSAWYLLAPTPPLRVGTSDETGTTHSTPPAQAHASDREDIAAPGPWAAQGGAAGDIDLEAAAAAGFDMMPGTAERAAAQLTPDEQRELIRLLRTVVQQVE